MPNTDRVEFFESVLIRTGGDTLMLSNSGQLGLLPRATRIGDAVLVLYGCSTPVILHKRDDGAYAWVGESYIQSVIHREAMAGLRNGVYQKETIMLR